MHVSIIIFFTTFMVAFILHLRNIAPTLKLSQRLVDAVRSSGGSITVSEIGQKLLFRKRLDVDINEADSEEIRVITRELIQQYEASMRFHRVVIGVIFCGFALSIVASIVFK